MTNRIWPPVVSSPSAPIVRRPAPVRPEERMQVRERDAAVSRENELRRLERALERYTRELDELERQVDQATPRNRRYNVNFSFDFVEQDPPPYPLVAGVPLAVDTRGAVVNGRTKFYAMALEMHYKLQSGGATFALGPINMREFFDFEWKVRDTGTDREWSNDWLPSDFLYSGDMCGLLTPAAPAILSGNSSIEVDVRVMKSADAGTGSLFANIEKHLLQISFVGVEVPE